MESRGTQLLQQNFNSLIGDVRTLIGDAGKSPRIHKERFRMDRRRPEFWDSSRRPIEPWHVGLRWSWLRPGTSSQVHWLVKYHLANYLYWHMPEDVSMRTARWPPGKSHKGHFQQGLISESAMDNSSECVPMDCPQCHWRACHYCSPVKLA